MSDNFVYLIKSDPGAIAREERGIQIMMFSAVAFVLTMFSLYWWAEAPEDVKVPPLVLVGIWLASVLVSALLCFRIRTFKENEVTLGADFLTGPGNLASTAHAVIKYEEITRVTLDIRRGRITGATVHARRLKSILARWVCDPALLVREILAHASPQVKWHRSGRPFTRLSRDDVQALIAQAPHLPDITRALPPGARFARADEMFPAGAGRAVEIVTLRRRG